MSYNRIKEMQRYPFVVTSGRYVASRHKTLAAAEKGLHKAFKKWTMSDWYIVQYHIRKRLP